MIEHFENIGGMVLAISLFLMGLYLGLLYEKEKYKGEKMDKFSEQKYGK